MALFQTPPGEGGKVRRLHWIYVPTPKGKSWTAHVAGPCLWFSCHTKGRSKPCLHAITNGELNCDKCSPLEVPAPTGYQPLYRESDGRPCFVVVHDYSQDQVAGLKLHQRVCIGRNEGSTDAVWIMPALKPEPRYQSRLPERMRPADITDSLLVLWAMPELLTWYAKHATSASKPTVPVSQPTPISTTTPPPRNGVQVKTPIERLMEAEERAKHEAVEEEKKLGGVMDTLLSGVKARNGVFKKK